jgi:hypothetical protein
MFAVVVVALAAAVIAANPANATMADTVVVRTKRAIPTLRYVSGCLVMLIVFPRLQNL